MRPKVNLSVCLFTAAALLLANSSFAATTYKIDASHSNVGFSVKHLGISTVNGKFGKMSGTLDYHKKKPEKSQVEFSMETASINTDHEKRDAHLVSADFFDAKTYPKISFKSKSIKKTRDGFVATGDLKMRDVSREVSIPFKFLGPVTDPWGAERLGVEGGLTIDRQKWNIKWNKNLDKGGVVVGNDVTINLSAEWIEQPKEAADTAAKPEMKRKK